MGPRTWTATASDRWALRACAFGFVFGVVVVIFAVAAVAAGRPMISHPAGIVVLASPLALALAGAAIGVRIARAEGAIARLNEAAAARERDLV